MTLGLFAPGTVFKLSINENHSRHLEHLYLTGGRRVAPAFKLWFMLDLLFVSLIL